MSSIRLLALVVAVGFALVAAGCGGGDDVKAANAYVAKVNGAQADFAKTVESLAGGITQRSTSAQDRTTMKNFTGAVDRVVADLEAVKAPDDVGALHAKLIAAITGYGEDVGSAATALSSGDADKLLAAQQKLLKATSTVSAQINATIAQINKKLKA